MNALANFCEKCGSLMLPKGKNLACTRCKNEKEILNRLEVKINSASSSRANTAKDRLLIVDREINTMPKTRAECPKCGNMEAEWWLVQTRKADEAETRFFRCTKCKYTWREYN